MLEKASCKPFYKAFQHSQSANELANIKSTLPPQGGVSHSLPWWSAMNNLMHSALDVENASTQEVKSWLRCRLRSYSRREREGTEEWRTNVGVVGLSAYVTTACIKMGEK